MKLTARQKRLRKECTRINGQRGGWNALLVLDHQSFYVVEQTPKVRAEWFRDMLAIALQRMISQNARAMPPATESDHGK